MSSEGRATTDVGAAPLAVDFADVCLSYPRGSFRLDLERFEVARGSSVALMGASGSGKTTLLNLIAGIALPERGRRIVLGHDLEHSSPAALQRFRIRQLGLVFQQLELIDYLTAIDNVLLPIRLAFGRGPTSAERARAEELLGSLGLSELLQRRPSELSGGERQRTALVRALILEPELLLADEPTGSLDALAADTALDLLLSEARRFGATLLVVTHDPRHLERFDDVRHAKTGFAAERSA